MKALMSVLRPPGCMGWHSKVERKEKLTKRREACVCCVCVSDRSGEGRCKSGCLSLPHVSRALTGLSMFYCAETEEFPRARPV